MLVVAGVPLAVHRVGRHLEIVAFVSLHRRPPRYGGTGLGLALSRSFCQMMGGDITVETSHCEGSTFTVILPTVVAEPAEAEPAT